jgi:DNA polymerase-3 subunit alpha
MAVKHVADAAIGDILEKRPFTSMDDLLERTEKRKVNSRVQESLVACGAMDSWGMRGDWTDEAKGNEEKRLLGFALAGKASISKFKALIEERCVTETEFEGLDTDETVFVAGEIIRINEIVTKKGDPMAFAEITYEGNDFALTFFPHQYLQYRHLLSEDNAIIVKGTKDSDRQTVLVDNCVLLAELAEALKNKAQEVAA